MATSDADAVAFRWEHKWVEKNYFPNYTEHILVLNSDYTFEFTAIDRRVCWPGFFCYRPVCLRTGPAASVRTTLNSQYRRYSHQIPSPLAPYGRNI